MSQSPYQGEQSDGDGRAEGSATAAETPAESNTYLKTAAAQGVPDLDATAPRLRSAEEQRLNRKALAFLAAILILVVAMGGMMLRTESDDDQSTKRTETTRATAPALPQLSSDTSTETDELSHAPPMPPLPIEPIRMRELVMPPRVPVRETEPVPSLVDRRIASGEHSAPESLAHSVRRTAQDDYTRMMASALKDYSEPQESVAARRGPEVDGDASSAVSIRSPDALLVRGAYLRCILETRIITDFAGYTSCLLTEPVYSINGQTMLLPRGSKIYGSYGGGPIGSRVEIIWDRITTPNGIDVAMSSPGIDQLGAAGSPGQYSAHWGSRIASAMMISLIADAFKYAAAESGPSSTTVTGGGLAVRSPYESATAKTMGRMAGEALSSRRPPTVTINQGTRVNVYVAKDIDFSQVLGR